MIGLNRNIGLYLHLYLSTLKSRDLLTVVS